MVYGKLLMKHGLNILYIYYNSFFIEFIILYDSKCLMFKETEGTFILVAVVMLVVKTMEPKPLDTRFLSYEMMINKIWKKFCLQGNLVIL